MRMQTSEYFYLLVVRNWLTIANCKKKILQDNCSLSVWRLYWWHSNYILITYCIHINGIYSLGYFFSNKVMRCTKEIILIKLAKTRNLRSLVRLLFLIKFNYFLIDNKEHYFFITITKCVKDQDQKLIKILFLKFWDTQTEYKSFKINFSTDWNLFRYIFQMIHISQ